MCIPEKAYLLARKMVLLLLLLLLLLYFYYIDTNDIVIIRLISLYDNVSCINCYTSVICNKSHCYYVLLDIGNYLYYSTTSTTITILYYYNELAKIY